MAQADPGTEGVLICSRCQTPIADVGEYNLDERGEPKCPDCPYRVDGDRRVD